MIDSDLTERVAEAIEREQDLDARDVAAEAWDGVVTLRGQVRSYGDKCGAERTALGVHGVRAVANELVVKPLRPSERRDTEIARAAAAALRWTPQLPSGRLSIAVSDGWLTLRGTVGWDFQREAAARAVQNLRGVKGLRNDVQVAPRRNATEREAHSDSDQSISPAPPQCGHLSLAS